MASIWLLSLAAMWAGAASAQTSPENLFADCPALPADAAESLRWSVLRAPDMLFCRALRIDNGDEAFALTVTRESPFKPRRSYRAEVGTLNGREVQWYRGELPNQPSVLIRETLIRFGEDRVVHISLRASDMETLLRHQQMVLSLPLPTPEED
jgi:hypothetical protein